MGSRGAAAALVVAVAAAGVGGGVWLGRSTGKPRAETLLRTTTETRTATAPADAAGLPAPVAATRAKLLAAAEAHDWAALGRLARSDGFSWTFGDAGGGPVEFWKRLQSTGARPLETMAALLRMPYVLTGSTYVWPFAYAEDPSRLTPYEKRLLAPVAGTQDVRAWQGYGSYTGYRLGIAPDGSWRYFIRGD